MPQPSHAFTVLIVDDDERALETYVAALHVEGYQVVTATNAADGVRQLAKRCPDVVLLDLHMQEASEGLASSDVSGRSIHRFVGCMAAYWGAIAHGCQPRVNGCELRETIAETADAGTVIAQEIESFAVHGVHSRKCQESAPAVATFSPQGLGVPRRVLKRSGHRRASRSHLLRRAPVVTAPAVWWTPSVSGRTAWRPNTVEPRMGFTRG